MPLQKVEITKINIDMTVLPRKADDQETLEHYIDIMRIGVKQFPPPVLFFDGKTYWLADGLYRIKAAGKVGIKSIPCEILKGDHSDARWYAAKANLAHGKPMSRADRRHAAQLLVNDRKYRKKSAVAISEQCGVNVTVVQTMRKVQADAEAAAAKKAGKKPPEPQKREVTTKGGKTYDKASTGGTEGGRPSKGKAKARAMKTIEDALGFEIPDRLRKVAEDSFTLAEFQTALSSEAARAQKIHDLSSGAGRFLDMQAFAACIQDLRVMLTDAQFYCCCPNCREKDDSPEDCICKGVGWFTETQHRKNELETEKF